MDIEAACDREDGDENHDVDDSDETYDDEPDLGYEESGAGGFGGYGEIGDDDPRLYQEPIDGMGPEMDDW